MYSRPNTVEYDALARRQKTGSSPIPLRQKVELEFEAAKQDASRPEYIRGILGQRHRVGELEERLATREDRIDELERQLAERSQIE